MPERPWPAGGRFGEFGGRYVPETLMAALEELESTYRALREDPSFWSQLDDLLRHYVGRPTPLYFAPRLTGHCGGARVLLKREDLAHTGSHKLNNCLGQVLLAHRMGKTRIIAETGAGQHGVATATVSALFGLQCRVYMGEIDMARQAQNVLRMRLLGADVVPVSSGTRTLKDATSEAMRDWVANVENTHYILGSVVGPHPYPAMVGDFQAVIGREARRQALEQAGALPSAVVACVGGGSNAIGIFSGFVHDEAVRLVGVEAGGRGEREGAHAASLSKGRPGVLHGAYSFLLQDGEGQVIDTHSVSAGLDYPGVGPEHSYLSASGRAEYVSIRDDEAVDAYLLLSRLEGILPALEPSHAIAHAVSMAAAMSPSEILLVSLSGRGDKDLGIVEEFLANEGGAP